MPFNILVGSYTRSVSTLFFDPTQSPPLLKFLSGIEIGHHPSWIAQHPTQKEFIVATIEQSDGKLVLLEFNSDGKGAIVQTVDSGGADPAHVEILENEIIAGNYSGSTILSIPYSPSAPHLLSPTSGPITFEGQGPKTERQEKSHPHQVYHHPTRKELLVPDLGADKVWRLLPTATGWNVQGSIDFEPGSGPRHAVIHEDILYTIGELTSTLIAHDLPPLPSPPSHLATISTLSAPPPEGSGMLAAEIVVSPASSISPSLLYVSNRNDPSPQGDPIAIFTPSSQTSNTPFAKVGELRTGLNHVRGMALSSGDGKYLVVGGANGGGIKVFERLIGGLEFKEVAVLVGEGSEKPTSFIWFEGQ